MFNEKLPAFSSEGVYRDATIKAVAQLEASLRPSLVGDAPEILDTVSTLIDRGARAGVSIVFSNLNITADEEVPEVPTRQLKSQGGSTISRISHISRQIGMQNNSDAMSLIAKQRVEVAALKKGTGRGGGQSAYTLQLLQVLALVYMTCDGCIGFGHCGNRYTKNTGFLKYWVF